MTVQDATPEGERLDTVRRAWGYLVDWPEWAAAWHDIPRAWKLRITVAALLAPVIGGALGYATLPDPARPVDTVPATLAPSPTVATAPPVIDVEEPTTSSNRAPGEEATARPAPSPTVPVPAAPPARPTTTVTATRQDPPDAGPAPDAARDTPGGPVPVQPGTRTSPRPATTTPRPPTTPPPQERPDGRGGAASENGGTSAAPTSSRPLELSGTGRPGSSSSTPPTASSGPTARPASDTSTTPRTTETSQPRETDLPSGPTGGGRPATTSGATTADTPEQGMISNVRESTDSTRNSDRGTGDPGQGPEDGENHE